MSDNFHLIITVVAYAGAVIVWGRYFQARERRMDLQRKRDAAPSVRLGPVEAAKHESPNH
jgi:hypothetical protein